jgi:hypothetical protein
VVGCKNAADGRKRAAAAEEDELRKGGKVASVVTRGDGDEILVMKRGVECSEEGLEPIAKETQSKGLGFTRVECEVNERVVGVDLPYVRSGPLEARMMLAHIGRNAKMAFLSNASYPDVRADLAPSAKCCTHPDHMCPVSHDWAKSPAWSALDVDVDEPSHFQYSYSCTHHGIGCDGAEAMAVGDLDCDGIMITYTLKMTAADGNPRQQLIEPPPYSD